MALPKVAILANIHRRRLRWIADAKLGAYDDELFPLNTWGPILSETARETLRYIEHLEKILDSDRREC